MSNDKNAIVITEDEALQEMQVLNGIVANAKEMMMATRMKFYVTNPFWASIVSKIPIYLVPVNSPIRTAAVDGRNMYVNPLFMWEIGEDGRMFVIAHELLHLINLTFQRQGSRDHKIWNMATDYANNQILVDSGFKMPSTADLQRVVTEMNKITGVDDEQLAKVKQRWRDRIKGDDLPVGLLDDKFRGMSAEEIYEEIAKDPGKYGLDKDGNGPGGLDCHIIGDGDGDGDDVTDADRLDMQAKMAQAKMENSDSRGDMPAGLVRVYEMMDKPRISWKDELHTQSQSFHMSDWTWSPPDPGMFSSGITIPYVEYETRLRVKIAIDTSGSISPDDIKNVMTEIMGIARTFVAFDLSIFCCDTQVYGEAEFDKNTLDDLTRYEVIGGGGTMFRPVMDKFAETADEYDWHIFFTDGYGESWCDEFADTVPNMLWLLNQGHGGESHRPNWGKVIDYNKYEN